MIIVLGIIGPIDTERKHVFKILAAAHFIFHLKSHRHRPCRSL